MTAAAGLEDRLFQEVTDQLVVRLQTTSDRRRLTREEMMGFANLTFAGGRDTIIHSISSIIAYLGRNSAALDYLRQDPKRIVHAGEEFRADDGGEAQPQVGGEVLGVGGQQDRLAPAGR